MAKASNNEMAAEFSRELGLKEIQQVLNSYGFYDTNHGGGIWVGKHYGKGDERYGDPVGDNSTRQLCGSCCVIIYCWSRANSSRPKLPKRCARFLNPLRFLTTTSNL